MGHLVFAPGTFFKAFKQFGHAATRESVGGTYTYSSICLDGGGVVGFSRLLKNPMPKAYWKI
jgi:hypothetical protein